MYTIKNALYLGATLLCLYGECIPIVQCFKYLEVYNGNNLKFIEHFKNIDNKCIKYY